MPKTYLASVSKKKVVEIVGFTFMEDISKKKIPIKNRFGGKSPNILK